MAKLSDITDIMRTLTLVGAQTAAYKALYEQVMAMVGEQDQAKLKAALQAAQQENDAGHAALQDLLNTAAGK